MNSSPIVFSPTTGRTTRQTLEALAANTEPASPISSSIRTGRRTLTTGSLRQAVREYLRTVTGFRSVNLSSASRTWAWANSVIAGVTEVLSRDSVGHRDGRRPADDEELSRFVNSALSTYEHRPDVFSVTGYNYPLMIPSSYREDAYLSYRSSSWGWGTWRRSVEPGRLVGRATTPSSSGPSGAGAVPARRGRPAADARACRCPASSTPGRSASTTPTTSTTPSVSTRWCRRSRTSDSTAAESTATSLTTTTSSSIPATGRSTLARIWRSTRGPRALSIGSSGRAGRQAALVEPSARQEDHDAPGAFHS